MPAHRRTGRPCLEGAVLEGKRGERTKGKREGEKGGEEGRGERSVRGKGRKERGESEQETSSGVVGTVAQSGSRLPYT